MLPYSDPNGGTQSFSTGLLCPYNAAPRTMPAFAFCAMQSSYAMLMLHRKSRTLKNDGYTATQTGSPTSSLEAILRDGLQPVVGALENYSIFLKHWMV